MLKLIRVGNKVLNLKKRHTIGINPEKRMDKLYVFKFFNLLHGFSCRSYSCVWWEKKFQKRLDRKEKV